MVLTTVLTMAQLSGTNYAKTLKTIIQTLLIITQVVLVVQAGATASDGYNAGGGTVF